MSLWLSSGALCALTARDHGHGNLLNPGPGPTNPRPCSSHPSRLVHHASCILHLLSRRYPSRIQEYQTRYPPIVHDPYAALYGHSPSSFPHEITPKGTKTHANSLSSPANPPHVLSKKNTAAAASVPNRSMLTPSLAH